MYIPNHLAPLRFMVSVSDSGADEFRCQETRNMFVMMSIIHQTPTFSPFGLDVHQPSTPLSIKPQLGLPSSAKLPSPSCIVWVMSESPEKPWSDKPNAPRVPYQLYLEEKELFAGTLINAILYGTQMPTFVYQHSSRPFDSYS